MSDKKIEIAYLGPKGTFSYESLMTFLSKINTRQELKDAELMEFDSFYFFSHFLIMKEIGSQNYEKYKKTFIPIENSIGGTITGNIDNLLIDNEDDPDIQIEAEHIQPIKHAIANQTGNIEDIKTVASHEQPIRQCDNYLNNLLSKKSIKKIDELYTPSTVAGIEMAKKDKTIAAIASYQTLINAGLKIIANDIQDNDNNATRFVLVGREKSKPTGDDKTSIAITLPAYKAGALYEVLGILANSNPPINMTKIESRPTKDEMGEYWFFIDIEGHQDDEHIGKALNEIKAKSKEYKFLGSYPRFRK